MADIVDAVTRSRMMSGIKAKDTKPEMAIRKMLHAAGFRYRLHDKRLPGKPDLVLPKYRTAVFVHGCFWHGHEGCSLFRIPKSKTEFWEEKISQNIKRDSSHISELLANGWRVLVIWECATKGANKMTSEDMILRIKTFLNNADHSSGTIRAI